MAEEGDIQGQDQDQVAGMKEREPHTEVDLEEEEETQGPKTWRREGASNVEKEVIWRETALKAEVEEETQGLGHLHQEVTEETSQEEMEERLAIALQDQDLEEAEDQAEIEAKEVTARIQKNEA